MSRLYRGLRSIDNVSKGAELKGANLWVLIFAIIIASIGLNVNSTAVIIGAMLISPLMGPLIAIGLGLSINDFDLIKRAIKNLGFALIMSLLASTVYFLLTPLDQAQTEILARTTPTIFDVFIAFAGGLAGMVATTRRIKGNVVPGVAIATALMPPLCTAGYGIASGNIDYFFGAFYLFFINSVFIFLGTFLIARSMHFKKKVFLDKVLEHRIRRYIFVMIAVTVIPSSYLAYNMISKSITERRINAFLEKEVSGRGLIILQRKIASKDGETAIELSTIGANVTEELAESLNRTLEEYQIKNSKLSFKRLDGDDSDKMKLAVIEELYKNNEVLIKDKDTKITLLEKELATVLTNSLQTEAITSELKVHLPSIEELILSKVQSEKSSKFVLLAYVKHSGKLASGDLLKTREWLKLRTRSDDVKLFTEVMVKVANAPKSL